MITAISKAGILPVRKFDPDQLGKDGVIPTAPLCQRCGVQATYENPVGVSFRKSAHPFGNWRADRLLDALCARCREFLKG